MQIVRLENESMRVAIRPDLGAGIGTCEMMLAGTWRPVMRGKVDASWFNDLACYVLAPWSNRIREARFDWETLGNRIRLANDWPDGSAIHGDVKTAQFTILDRSPQSVRLRAVRDGSSWQNWPWKYECIVRYQLDGTQLSVSVTVNNVDDRAMPCGLGLHPFFPMHIAGDTAQVRLLTAGRYPCEGMFPVSPAREDELCRHLRAGWKVTGGLDDVFRMQEGANDALIQWPEKLKLDMNASSNCTHAVIYSGEAGSSPMFFCVELVTHVNDGFNLATRGWDNTGVQVLAPGEVMRLDTVFGFQELQQR